MPALPECVLIYSARHGESAMLQQGEAQRGILRVPLRLLCLAASGSVLKLRTRRGSRASSFGCKKSAEDVPRWNFDAGECRTVLHTAFGESPQGCQSIQLSIAHFAQSKKICCRPCLSTNVYWTVVGHHTGLFGISV